MTHKESKTHAAAATTTTLNHQPHVAVLAFPFSTHAAPLLATVRRLAAASPTTLFSFFNTAHSNRSLGLSADSSTTHHNIQAYDISDGVPEGYVFAGKPQEEIELFMRAAPLSFKEGVEAAAAETGKRVSCLLTDAFFWFAAEMAVEMEAPWIAFWTAGPTSLSAHLHTDIIRDKFQCSLVSAPTDETPLDFIQGMSKIRVRDLPEGIVFGNLKSLFSEMLHLMGRALPAAAAVFLNSFEELDPIITHDLKSKLSSFLSIGPTNLIQKTLHSENDSDACLQWLHTQKAASVVYVSFGSVTVPPRAELLALADGLEASGAPFLWSLKKTNDLPEGFVERTIGQGKVVPWAPQEAILSHAATGAFVTHCGWNSLLESVAGGVPMICRPFFGDQRINGRVIEEVLGIGVKMKGGIISKEGLLRSLRMILLGEEGREMRKRMEVVREKAEWAVGPDGTSNHNFNQLVKLVDSS